MNKEMTPRQWLIDAARAFKSEMPIRYHTISISALRIENAQSKRQS